MSNPIQQIPEVGFFRLQQVLNVFPVSKSTWWAGIATGRYPAGVKIGARCTAWRCEDIAKLVNSIGKEAV